MKRTINILETQKKFIRRIIILIIIPVLIVSALTASIFATEEKVQQEEENIELSVLKEAVKGQGHVGEFDVSIHVPGFEEEKKEPMGYNIIFVMDGSTSTGGEEWKSMRNSLLSLLDKILPNEDAKSNINSAALITFGIDYHINIELTNDRNTFANVIPGESGGNLLAPGRSSTNIEAGLKGAREYLESIEGTALEKDDAHTIVVLMTDGEVNMSEVPFNYYDPDSTTLYDVLDAEGALTKRKTKYIEDRKTYYVYFLTEIESNDEYVVDNFYRGQIATINSLYETTIGSGEGVTLINKVKALRNNADTKEQMESLLADGIEKIYSLINYTPDMELSPGEYERLFMGKDLMGYEELNNCLYDTYLQTLFYVVYAPKYYHADRVIAEGNTLDERATIYTIGYGIKDSRKDAFKILNPNFEGSGVYTSNADIKHYSTEFSKASTTTLENILKELFKNILDVRYRDLEIVDYTSKWVNPMDMNGDGIFDENDITITNNDQQVKSEIKVEKLTQEEIDVSTDEEIKGNTNGDIYRITWNLSGYIYSWDKYKLAYRVKVDNQESDFISENKYNANGNVSLTYDIIEKTVDDEGNEVETVIKENHSGEISVTDPITQKENVIIVTRTDEEGNFLPGTDFEITSENGNNNIVKEYSKDGIHYTTEDLGDEAIYIRFSGLYDFEYTLTEIKKNEDGYVTSEEKKITFNDIEGSFEEVSIINKHKMGNAIIHYAVKVGEEYIPFKDYAYDEKGNLNSVFENINLDDVTLTGKVGESFETTYEDVEGLVLNGLYYGDLAIDSSALSKLDENKVNGIFKEEVQEYTYVFEIKVEETAPETGDEWNNGYVYLMIISITGLLYIGVKSGLIRND